MSRDVLPKPTDRLALGDSGLSVSPLCLGMVSDPATVSAAYDAGFNFFFVSCDMHWPLYEGLRRGLEALLAREDVSREDVVVAGVTYVAQPEFLWLPFEEVLDAVDGLERIDVVVCGGTYAADLDARTEVLRKNMDAGLVGAKAIGASFHDRTAARDCIERSLLDIAFVRYNAGHPGALADLFPHIGERQGIRVFNFKSTNGYVPHDKLEDIGVPDDMWFPEVADHYRLALSRPELDGALCSPNTPGELATMLDALGRGGLSEADQHYLIKLAMLASGAAELE